MLARVSQASARGQELQFNPPGEAAVVVGQGNVALDVARLLLRSPPDLHATDMDSKAVEARWGRECAGSRATWGISRTRFQAWSTLLIASQNAAE